MNTTDSTFSYVVSVDSDSQLTLYSDIMANAEAYTIYSNYISTVTFSNAAGGDLHLASGDFPIDKGLDLGDGLFDTDIDGRDRDTEGDTWDIGADEYVTVAGGRIRRLF